MSTGQQLAVERIFVKRLVIDGTVGGRTMSNLLFMKFTKLYIEKEKYYIFIE